MYIILRFFGKAVIDDVRHVINMQSAPCDVGRHEHLQLALAERFQRLHALVLCNFPGQQPAAHPIAIQIVRQLAHLIAAIVEDDDLVGPLGGNQVVQQLVLVFRRDEIDDLIDGVRCHFFRLDLHHDRVHRPALGQFQNFRREGRTEKQCLPAFLGGCACHDGSHLGYEAHVQHAIGFVDDHQFHKAQIDLVVLHEVNQAAWRRHHDVDGAAVHGAQLFLIVLAAHHGHDMQIGVLAQQLRVTGNLHHQLARRRDDQGTGLADIARLLDGIADQVVDDGDEKRGRLASACLGAPGDVIALERIVQALGLNGCAVGETEICDGLVQRFNQIECREAQLLVA